MRYLLDTHALLWWWDDDRRLSSRARTALAAREHQIFVSATSGLELAIKVRIGKLPDVNRRILDYDESVTREGFIHLPIDHGHGVRAGLLPGDHRDPFDRLLAAQALTEDLTVLTRDPQIAAFGCKVLW